MDLAIARVSQIILMVVVIYVVELMTSFSKICDVILRMVHFGPGVLDSRILNAAIEADPIALVIITAHDLGILYLLIRLHIRGIAIRINIVL